MDKPAQRYLKRLSRGLVCAREDRERLLKDAVAMLELFAQETPGAFYKDYVDSFGPPEEFAAQMLSSLDPEDVSEARLRRKRAMAGMVAAAVAVVVLVLGFWFGRQSRPRGEAPSPLPELTAPVSTPEAFPTPEPAPEETGGSERKKAEVRTYLEELFTDSGAIYYDRAVAAMLQLNVMVAGEEFCPDEPVTRALAAKFMTLMLTGGKEITWSVEAVEKQSSFSDTQGYWAERFIEYCVGMGIVSGNGDGVFDPGAPVTGVEFAKMALAALGYDPVAYQFNGPNWADCVNRVACNVCEPYLYEGLLERGMIAAEAITREQAAQIMYNMLDNAVMGVTLNPTPVIGETTYTYSHIKDENGQSRTFFDLHFSDWDREDIF